MTNNLVLSSIKNPEIDIYTGDNKTFDIYSVYWKVSTKKRYENTVNKINNLVFETEWYILYLWCDISSFEYIQQEGGDNYCQLTLTIKKEIPDSEVKKLLRQVNKLIKYQNSLSII